MRDHGVGIRLAFDAAECEAAHQPFAEEEEERHRGDAHDQRGRGVEAPLGAHVGLEGLEADGESEHVLVVQHLRRDDVFGPRGHEGEQRRDHQRRRGEGEYHAIKGSESPESVDARGLLEAEGDGVVVALHLPDAEGQRGGRVDDDESDEGVDQLQLRHHDEERQQQHGGGEHLRHEQAQQSGLAPRETEAREGVARGGGERDADDHHGHGNQQGIAHPEQEGLVAEQRDVVLEGRALGNDGERVAEQRRARTQRDAHHLQHGIHGDGREQDHDRVDQGELRYAVAFLHGSVHVFRRRAAAHEGDGEQGEDQEDHEAEGRRISVSIEIEGARARGNSFL